MVAATGNVRSGTDEDARSAWATCCCQDGIGQLIQHTGVHLFYGVEKLVEADGVGTRCGLIATLPRSVEL